MEKIKNFFAEHAILITVIFGFVLLAIVLAYFSIKMLFSASLDILVVPAEAKIMIDGQNYENEKIYEGLMAKTVHVDISMDGFDSQSFDLELKRDETVRLYTYLTGNDDWYKEHANDEKVSTALELINEHNGEVEVQSLFEKYPIMSVLPIVYEKYLNNYSNYISYRVDVGEFDGCKGEFCIMITDISGGNYDRALQAIRDKGFSPEDYEILYQRGN